MPGNGTSRASCPSLNHVSGPIVTLESTSLPYLGLMDPDMQESSWQTTSVKAWDFPGLWATYSTQRCSPMFQAPCWGLKSRLTYHSLGRVWHGLTKGHIRIHTL